MQENKIKYIYKRKDRRKRNKNKHKTKESEGTAERRRARSIDLVLHFSLLWNIYLLHFITTNYISKISKS